MVPQRVSEMFDENDETNNETSVRGKLLFVVFIFQVPDCDPNDHEAENVAVKPDGSPVNVAADI